MLKGNGQKVAAFDKMGVNRLHLQHGHGATASAVRRRDSDAAVLQPSCLRRLSWRLPRAEPRTGRRRSSSRPTCISLYTAATMPAAWASARGDVPTASSGICWCSKVRGAEDYIYLTIKTLENNPLLMEIHKSLEYCTVENILTTRPRGYGAVLQEAGIEVPDERFRREYQK